MVVELLSTYERVVFGNYKIGVKFDMILDQPLRKQHDQPCLPQLNDDLKSDANLTEDSKQKSEKQSSAKTLQKRSIFSAGEMTVSINGDAESRMRRVRCAPEKMAPIGAQRTKRKAKTRIEKNSGAKNYLMVQENRLVLSF